MTSEQPLLASEIVLARVDRLGTLGDEDQLEAMEPHDEVLGAHLCFFRQVVQIPPPNDAVPHLGSPDLPGRHSQARLMAVHGAADLVGVLTIGQPLVEAFGTIISQRPLVAFHRVPLNSLSTVDSS